MWWMDGSPYQDYEMVIAEGSIRAGKTVAMIDSFLMWSITNHENQSFIIAGKSIGALKRNVLKPMFEILQSKNIPYKYHRSDHYIQIGTNIYYCFGANNESSQDVLQGLTAAGAYLDEVALMPKSFVDQAIGRCSVDGSRYFFNCNPAGPYHWFKTEFIDNAEDKKALVLHFTMDDNLSLSERVKDRFKRMFSGVFYKRYILGLWVMAEGIIYDMFNELVHKVKTEPREYTKYYISCDYGTQNPMSFGLWGYYDKWYKTKEYHYDGRKKAIQKTDQEYFEDLEEFAEGLCKTIIVDPSASSFITLLKKKGWKVIKAKNDVQDGIRNMSTALNNELIVYNDCCKETFREFSSYVWDEKAVDRGEDKPKKENDHQMDSDRYFVNTILFKGNTIQILK